TVIGVLSLGDLTLLSGTFARSRDLVQRTLLTTSDLYEQALYLDDLFVFFAMEPSIRRPENPVPVPRPLRQGFELRDVWFRYPSSVPPSPNGEPGAAADPREEEFPADDPGWVLRGVNMRIPPAGKLALVGENGAGKTTLIKLLLRLYEPTRGESLLEGRPLAGLDRWEDQREGGVIFQDFVRYDMKAEENMAVGRISARADEAAEARVRVEDAAGRSLAAGVADSLPQRYGTMLGRRFEGGVDLSG